MPNLIKKNQFQIAALCFFPARLCSYRVFASCPGNRCRASNCSFSGRIALYVDIGYWRSAGGHHGGQLLRRPDCRSVSPTKGSGCAFCCCIRLLCCYCRAEQYGRFVDLAVAVQLVFTCVLPCVAGVFPALFDSWNNKSGGGKNGS